MIGLNIEIIQLILGGLIMPENLMQEKKATFKMFGMPWYVALVVAAIVLFASTAGYLPKNSVGAFALLYLSLIHILWEQMGVVCQYLDCH